jgi:type I restriction enzyme S subunit
MIEELCPNGVEYKKIGSLITKNTTKGKDCKEVCQVYVVSNTKGIVRSEDFHENNIHSEDTSNYTVIRPGMFAYNPARLNIGSIGILNNNEPGLVSPMYVVFSIDETIINKNYFLLNLKSSYVKFKINSLKEEGARFRFEFERWNKIEIPVPPLEIQEKIVEILDTFTQLEAELETELQARRQQYQYYRDSLLHFDKVGGYNKLGWVIYVIFVLVKIISKRKTDYILYMVQQVLLAKQIKILIKIQDC